MTRRLTHRDVMTKALRIEFKAAPCDCDSCKRSSPDPELVAAVAQFWAREKAFRTPDPELAVIAARVKARDREMRFLLVDPPRTRLPEPQRQALEELARFACKALGIDEPEVVYYERDPEDGRLGFFQRLDPDRVWVSAEGDGYDKAHVLVHELAHKSGVRDEDEACRIAADLVKRWHR